VKDRRASATVCIAKHQFSSYWPATVEPFRPSNISLTISWQLACFGVCRSARNNGVRGHEFRKSPALGGCFPRCRDHRGVAWLRRRRRHGDGRREDALLGRARPAHHLARLRTHPQRLGAPFQDVRRSNVGCRPLRPRPRYFITEQLLLLWPSVHRFAPPPPG
jgi:hypothetical protein